MELAGRLRQKENRVANQEQSETESRSDTNDQDSDMSVNALSASKRVPRSKRSNRRIDLNSLMNSFVKLARYT